MEDTAKNSEDTATAYCVKCREKDREMVDPEEVEINKKGGKKGRALKGTCKVCSTKMMKFLPNK